VYSPGLFILQKLEAALAHEAQFRAAAEAETARTELSLKKVAAEAAATKAEKEVVRGTQYPGSSVLLPAKCG
jgi:hypothetical protein